MPVRRDPRTNGWYFRTTVKLPNGTRSRISGTPGIPGPFHDLAASKVGAQEAERRGIAAAMAGVVPGSNNMEVQRQKQVPTIEDFADRFETEYLPRSKPTERKSKSYILSGSIVPYFGAMRLDEITQSHVNAFISSQKGLATKTVNNRLTVLSTMLRYAAAIGLIEEPKLKCHIKSMSPDIIAVSMANVAKLIETADDDRYKVAVLLASEAGLRIGEIRGLQHTDVRDGQLTVRRAIDQSDNVTTPKHDKRRSVPLSPALETALGKIAKRGLWVLANEDGEPMTYERLLDGLNALYELASVTVPVSESGVTMPWHSLRHTFGTECAARGVPLPVIKELMGHSSISTTMRYVTVTGDQLDSAIRQTFGVAATRQQENATPKKRNPPGSNS